MNPTKILLGQVIRGVWAAIEWMAGGWPFSVDTYDAIIDAACQAWQNSSLDPRPSTTTSIRIRQWAHVGQEARPAQGDETVNLPLSRINSPSR